MAEQTAMEIKLEQQVYGENRVFFILAFGNLIVVLASVQS